MGSGRPGRLEVPGGWYHVINRGHQRRAIFRDRRCYEDFLERLDSSCLSFFESPQISDQASYGNSRTIIGNNQCTAYRRLHHTYNKPAIRVSIWVVAKSSVEL
jgi:hypothetical protein